MRTEEIIAIVEVRTLTPLEAERDEFEADHVLAPVLPGAPVGTDRGERQLTA